MRLGLDRQFGPRNNAAVRVSPNGYRVATTRRLALGILAAALLLGVPRLAVGFHGERVYVANQACKGHAYRPGRVVLACGDGNLYATRIKYAAYGQKVATATATVHLNDCTPYCAAGHFRSYIASIRFQAIARCRDGRLYYSRVRYRFAGPHGSGSANLSPFEQCSRVVG
jgi:hypothetical protein